MCVAGITETVQYLTFKLADEIFADLDEEKMAELNAQVDVEGMPVEQVAKKYLEDIGLL